MSSTDPSVPYGYCHCGCGEKTPLSPESDATKGWVKGEPRKWIPNHHLPLSHVRHVEEDRGYITPCWIWQRSLNSNGYGQAGMGRGLAHRAAYEDRRGPIPDDLHVDHLCRVRGCVNPDHLEAVTQTENNRRQSNQTLSMRKAREIRDEFSRWQGTKWAFCRFVAPRFGVTPTSIDYLLRGKTWREDGDLNGA